MTWEPDDFEPEKLSVWSFPKEEIGQHMIQSIGEIAHHM